MPSKSERRIVNGPLPWEIARFGTPLAIGMALQTTFNLVDTYLVAQLPKAEVGPALGALGLCDQVAAIGTILSYGISSATTSLLAQRQGARDTQGVQRTAWQSMLIVLALSAVFGLVGGVFAEPLVRNVIGAKGEVAQIATEYLRVIVGGSFSIFVLLEITAIQRALGSAKTPAFLLVSGNVINVGLAVVMIFGEGPAPAALAWGHPVAHLFHVPAMGMVGAAWATVIARAVILVPSFMLLARRMGIRLPPRGERGPDREIIGKIIAIAWPSSTQFVVRIVGMLITSSLVARYFTTATDQTASTAMGLVFRLDTMALFVAMGWGSAAQTFVGQNIGANKLVRAVRSGWWTAAFDAVTNVVLVIAILKFGEVILRAFDDDALPVSIAMTYIRAVAPSYLALGFGVVLGHAMAGAGATKTVMWIDLLVILGLQLPVSFAAVALFGGSRLALFQCVAVTNLVGALGYLVVYLRGGWKSEFNLLSLGAPLAAAEALPLPVTDP